MSLPIQSGFWQAKILTDTRGKLADLYSKNSEIANSERKTIVEYWKHYDGLPQVLGAKLDPFLWWFSTRATSPETITRCLRSLKEKRVINISESKAKIRQEREKQHRSFWAQYDQQLTQRPSHE
ncbi:hypothetical protein ACFLYB_03240 [Chloroflexota bacterium]